VPHWAHNKLLVEVKARYFELIRAGRRGAAAAREIGVSTSCGSLWFIDAGSMIIAGPTRVSSRFLAFDERIAIADGLQATQPVKQIAADIGKSFQTVYREIGRNSKPAGRYNPWWAHNLALLRRRRPKAEKLRVSEALRTLVREKLSSRWSPQRAFSYFDGCGTLHFTLGLTPI
jgi:transposase, IS30 family